MAFKLYADKKLQKEADIHVTFTGIGNVDAVVYFGSNNPDEYLTPATDAQIILKPVNLLKKWQPNYYYAINDIIEPTSPNGYMYRCVQAGKTTDTEPEWWVGKLPGKAGNAVFVECGQVFSPTAIKLALSRSALGSAIGGEGVKLGAKLQGGKAIPVYIRINNDTYDIDNDLGCASRGLGTNETITTTTEVEENF